MRNAATFDDEFGYDTTPKKNPQRKSRSVSASTKKKNKRQRFDLHRVARYGAIGMAATIAVGIMVNALMLQKGHHPAPFFGKAPAPVATTAALKPAPLPPARTAQLPDEAPVPAPAPPLAKPHRAAAHENEASPADDAIGRLLAKGAVPAAATHSDEKTVRGVQRALAKLGFKVPVTGSAGPATRKAIESFEKDRHMAVKGEISHRLIKILAAESGAKVE